MHDGPSLQNPKGRLRDDPGAAKSPSSRSEFTVRLKKNANHAWPRGETESDIFTVGNARPLDQALQHATTEMLNWLGTGFGLDPTSASHLLGQVVRYTRSGNS